jgi:hypothetical protein
MAHDQQSLHAGCRSGVPVGFQRMTPQLAGAEAPIGRAARRRPRDRCSGTALRRHRRGR